MITRSERIVLCAAVIVRAALPILAFMHARDGRIFTSPDTGSYIACAASLARGEGFTTGGEPEIARTPGYPLLLVPGVLARHLAAVTIPLQIALGVLTVWLVFSLTGSLTGRPRAAFIAGLFCAYEPLSIFYCSLLLTETLFATVLLVSLFFLVRFLNAGHAPALALSACGFAAAVYVRPIAYWLPLAMVTVILASIWEGRDNRTRKIFGGCAFLALCVVLIGAWQVRNYHVAGYRGFSAISDSSLYFYQGAAVHSALTGEAYDTVQRERGFSLNQEQKNSTPAQRYSYMGNEGRTIIRAHPLVFMREYVKGLVRTAFGPGATEYLRIFGLYKEGHGLLGEFSEKGCLPTLWSLPRRKPLIFWSNLFLGVVLGIYLICALLSLRVRNVSRIVFATVTVPAFYLLLMSGGLSGNSRFRHPVMPLVCVLAGCGVDAALRPAKRGRARGIYQRGGARDAA